MTLRYDMGSEESYLLVLSQIPYHSHHLLLIMFVQTLRGRLLHIALHVKQPMTFTLLTHSQCYHITTTLVYSLGPETTA